MSRPSVGTRRTAALDPSQTFGRSALGLLGATNHTGSRTSGHAFPRAERQNGLLERCRPTLSRSAKRRRPGNPGALRHPGDGVHAPSVPHRGPRSPKIPIALRPPSRGFVLPRLSYASRRPKLFRLAVCPVLNAGLVGADVQGGEKLAGAWRLVSMKPRTKKGGVSWLLIKAQDGVARSATAPGIREERPLVGHLRARH
jgi:hypothetical protein